MKAMNFIKPYQNANGANFVKYFAHMFASEAFSISFDCNDLTFDSFEFIILKNLIKVKLILFMLGHVLLQL